MEPKWGWARLIMTFIAHLNEEHRNALLQGLLVFRSLVWLFFPLPVFFIRLVFPSLPFHFLNAVLIKIMRRGNLYAKTLADSFRLWQQTRKINDYFFKYKIVVLSFIVSWIFCSRDTHARQCNLFKFVGLIDSFEITLTLRIDWNVGSTPWKRALVLARWYLSWKSSFIDCSVRLTSKSFLLVVQSWFAETLKLSIQNSIFFFKKTIRKRKLFTFFFQDRFDGQIIHHSLMLANRVRSKFDSWCQNT